MQNATETRGNLPGGAWLIADMSFNICALSIVKALGLGYPAAQLVFLRAIVGLLVTIPWIWVARDAFYSVDRWRLHGLRIVFSTLALAASFFAISRLPFALFTAISFTRPVVTMILAAIILKEVIIGRRWIAAAVAFGGVMIAIAPAQVVLSWGLPAMGATVLFGTSAIIVTRQLAGTPTVVMMAFYTGGLSVLTAPFAITSWQQIAPDQLFALLAIGVLAQAAQFCFLNAHARAEAGFLAILSYLSLLLTTAIGYVVFDEVPTLAFAAGAALIIVAAVSTTLQNAAKSPPS
ncbi:DMT family transporter [Litoreibacter sp.]|nr:DMT family transporter [Litoreibacter sp.]